MYDARANNQATIPPKYFSRNELPRACAPSHTAKAWRPPDILTLTTFNLVKVSLTLIHVFISCHTTYLVTTLADGTRAHARGSETKGGAMYGPSLCKVGGRVSTYY